MFKKNEKIPISSQTPSITFNVLNKKNNEAIINYFQNNEIGQKDQNSFANNLRLTDSADKYYPQMPIYTLESPKFSVEGIKIYKK